MPSDPFRDEIAIDFPAVRPYVARARERFLAEDTPAPARSLTAEVRVSRLQASLGAIVPVEIQLHGVCLTCGGRGETWNGPCLTCERTGNVPERHFLRVPVPPGSVDGSRLYFRINPPHAASVRVEVRIAVTCSQDLTR
jgi:hypothetical protein